MTASTDWTAASFQSFAAANGLRDLTADSLIDMAALARRAAETGALIPRQTSKWLEPPALFIVARI